MRRATYGLVGLTLTGVEHLAHAALKHIQGPFVIHLALHNVKLRATGGLLGVHLVRFAGSSQSAFFVEVIVLDFGRDGISWVEATVGILSTLDHEVLDDTVERRSIVPSFVDQLDKVVAMLRRVVIKFGFNRTHVRLDDDDGFLFCCFLSLASQSDQNQSC